LRALAAQALLKPQPTFDFVEIRFPGAMTTNATGINNFGSIVGSYSIDVFHPRLQADQSAFRTSTSRINNDLCARINNNGDFVGFFTLPGDLKLHASCGCANGTF